MIPTVAAVVLMLLIVGWIIASYVAGDPVERWKRERDQSDDEPPE